MSLLTKGGITRLSELIIDADKDWQTYGITNIRGVAAGMNTGDLAVRSAVRLERLLPDTANLVLTSAGPGHMPHWAPGGLYLWRFFPVSIDLSHTETLNPAPEHTQNEPGQIDSRHVTETGDAVLNLLKMEAPVVDLNLATAINPAPDYSNAENPPVASAVDINIVVEGAVADDGGVETDETAEAKDATANDMTLLPAAPAVGDAYYFGYTEEFDRLSLNIGTPGVGLDWALTWKYWDGAAWSNLADVVDDTSNFQAAGWRDVSFTRPGDWARTIIQGRNLHWIKAELSGFTNLVTQPLGTQAKITIYDY